jgi:hypothetical protein
MLHKKTNNHTKISVNDSKYSPMNLLSWHEQKKVKEITINRINNAISRHQDELPYTS